MSAPSPTSRRVLKGAAGHVFATIHRLVTAGRSEMTFSYLAYQSHYSMPSVMEAVACLEREGLITVHRRGPGRAHRYAVNQSQVVKQGEPTHAVLQA